MDSVSQQLPPSLLLADGPPTWRVPSLATRWLTSWKLWTLALIIALFAIGMAVSWRAVRRHQAFEYLDDKRGTYELTSDSEWITEWFGDWAKPFRDVDSISLAVVSDESFSHIGAFPELRRLSTSNFPQFDNLHGSEFLSISESGFRGVMNLTQLEEAVFRLGGMSDDQLCRLFSARPPLRSVTLHCMDVGRSTMLALTGIPTLSELQFSWFCDPNDDDFFGMPPMPNLRTLVLSDVGVHKAQWLSQSTQLRELDLQSTTVTPEILQCITNLKELKTLSLVYDCDITDNRALTCLVALPRLTSLSLPRESVTWETLETLRRMPKLERITLDRGIDDRELDRTIRREWRCSSLDTGCF